MELTKPKLSKPIYDNLSNAWQIIGPEKLFGFVNSYAGKHLGNMQPTIDETNIYTVCVNILNSVSERDFLAALNHEIFDYYIAPHDFKFVLNLISSEFLISIDTILKTKEKSTSNIMYCKAILTVVLVDIYNMDRQLIADKFTMHVGSLNRYVTIIANLSATHPSEKDIYDKYIKIKREVLSHKNSASHEPTPS